MGGAGVGATAAGVGPAAGVAGAGVVETGALGAAAGGGLSTAGAGAGVTSGAGVAAATGRSPVRRPDSFRSMRGGGPGAKSACTWNAMGGPSGSDANRHVLSVCSIASAYGDSPSRIAASATVPSASSVTSATTLAGSFAPCRKEGCRALPQLRNAGRPRHVGQLQGEGDRHGQTHRHRLSVDLGDLVLPLASGRKRGLVERRHATQDVRGRHLARLVDDQLDDHDAALARGLGGRRKDRRHEADPLGGGHVAPGHLHVRGRRRRGAWRAWGWRDGVARVRGRRGRGGRLLGCRRLWRGRAQGCRDQDGGRVSHAVAQASSWTSLPRSAFEVAMIFSCRWLGTSS